MLLADHAPLHSTTRLCLLPCFREAQLCHPHLPQPSFPSCSVYPTRTARFGVALVPSGVLRLKNSCHAKDYKWVWGFWCGWMSVMPEAHPRTHSAHLFQPLYLNRPIDESCSCMVCKNYTRCAIHNVIHKLPSASMLVTYHNIAYMQNLTRRMRAAIKVGGSLWCGLLLRTHFNSCKAQMLAPIKACSLQCLSCSAGASPPLLHTPLQAQAFPQFVRGFLKDLFPKGERSGGRAVLDY